MTVMLHSVIKITEKVSLFTMLFEFPRQKSNFGCENSNITSRFFKNVFLVVELYEMVTANQSVALALPEVVDRLDSLQALHEQSLQFSKTLLQLDSLQQKLQTNLSTNEKVLQETQGKFSENLETIQKNFDAMDQRLNKLKK